jgi:ubiquinone/menaquinone biosynthesis C-methylase UbiE
MMASAAQKGYIGIGMKGPVARWYEKTTRKDIAEFRKLAGRLGALLPDGGDILEVAPGPGFLSVELAGRSGFRVTGLDISPTMVELAQKNAAAARADAKFVQGNASQMPFADASFDLLVCRAAFKNFSEPGQALCEMHRVLRPGGQALIIDLRRDASMPEINHYIGALGLGLFSRWMTRLTFRFMLLRRAYTVPEFQQLLAGIPFNKTEIHPHDIGMEVWLQK